MHFLYPLIPALIKTCHDVGKMQVQRQADRAYQSYQKDDASIVTDVDLLSHQIFQNFFQQHLPNYPLLSEEGDHSIKDQGQGYFILDPLDGTQSFHEGSSSFAINLAFVREERVIWGLMHVPTLGQTWVSRLSSHEEPHVLVYDLHGVQKILPPPSIVPLMLASPRQIKNPKFLAWHQENYSHIPLESASSSLKFIDLILGKGQYYPRLKGMYYWDVAAGQALVQSMGGQVLNPQKTELGYPSDQIMSQAFIAKMKA